MTTTMTQRQKYRWEIDPKTNDVKRVRAEEMHHESFQDFKKVLELGMEQTLLTPRERAKVKSRTAELARRRKALQARRSRRKSRADSDSDSSTRNLTPRQRTKRRRARLARKVNNEVRRCGNTVKLMKAFPPVFKEQCTGLSGGLSKLGGLFRNAIDQCDDLESKIAKKRAKIEEMDRQYALIKKRRNRLMFNKLAEKARRIKARRKRIKEREEREENEERNRNRSRSRNGRMRDEDDMTVEEVLEVMAEKQPHAAMALQLSEFLDQAAPPRSTTQLEYKLHIGDVVNSFMGADNVVESTAKDIILHGVEEYFVTQAKKKLLGGGKESAFDAQFGTTFEKDEFAGYTDEDVADMKPHEVTRYYAWQRWSEKEKEWAIVKTIAQQDARELVLNGKKRTPMGAMETVEDPVTSEEVEDTVDEDEDLFATLMDW